VPTSYTLDADAVQRTAAAVRYVEGQTRNSATTQRRRHNTPATPAAVKIGVLSTSLDYGSGASVTFYSGTPGSEAPDGTGTHTCYGWMLKSGDSINASTEVVCALINGHWYVIQAACPSSS
jgi:hypothetical protein